MKPNAFTIGVKKAYDQALQNGAVKVGRHEGYEGGCVWRTRDEAESYLERRGGYIQFNEDRPSVLCAVYGLILQNGWEQDVDSTHYERDGYHLLLNDAQLVECL